MDTSGITRHQAAGEPSRVGLLVLGGLLTILAALLFTKIYEPYRRGKETARKIRQVEAELAAVIEKNRELAERSALLDTDRGKELAVREQRYIRKGEVPMRAISPQRSPSAPDEQAGANARPLSMAQCVAQEAAAAAEWFCSLFHPQPHPTPADNP